MWLGHGVQRANCHWTRTFSDLSNCNKQDSTDIQEVYCPKHQLFQQNVSEDSELSPMRHVPSSVVNLSLTVAAEDLNVNKVRSQ